MWSMSSAARACVIRVGRRLKAADVIDVLADLFILRGIPGYIRSDNGPEFVAKAVQAWITGGGAKTAFIEPGSPWENGCVESFNAKLRDELLNAEVFHTLAEARVLIEQWRQHYNTQRPHAALGYRPPAPEVLLPMLPWRDRGSGPTGSSQGGIILAHQHFARTPQGGPVSRRASREFRGRRAAARVQPFLPRDTAEAAQLWLARRL
jgi:hypothetical protein